MPDATSYLKDANLKGQPFSRNLPGDHLDDRNGIWAGYESAKNKIIRTITDVRADRFGNPSFQFIYGDYGVGKTHACRWIKYYILAEKKEEFDSCVYILNKVINLNKVNFKFAYDNYLMNGSSYVNDVTGFKRWFEEYISGHPERPNKSKNELITSLFPHDHSTASKVSKLMEVSDDLDSMFQFLSVTNDEQALSNMILYLNIFTRQFEHEGTTNPSCYKKAVYLMIDELDLAMELPVAQNAILNQNIRRIADEVDKNFSFILTATATAAEREGLLEEMNLTRLDDSSGISLTLMLPDEVIEFTKEILEAYRIDQNDAKKNGFFPFDEDFISQIAESIPEMQPRILFRKLDKALKWGELQKLDLNKKLITSDFILKHEPDYFDY